MHMKNKLVLLMLVVALGSASAYSKLGPAGNTWTDKYCADIPLCDAAGDGKLLAVQELLAKEANVDEQDKDG